MKRHVLFVAFVVTAFWLGSSLSGATLVVDLNGGADYTDIQSAIDAAADGDTVLVKPGEYVITDPINFNRLHNPDDPLSPPVKNIVVRSEGGADSTTIRSGGVSFLNGETQASVLDGFMVTGGDGVHCTNSSPTLTNCTITGNTTEKDGGGVYCENSSPILTNCTIAGNTAFGWYCDSWSCWPYGVGGGVLCGENSSPTLTSCTIAGNSGGGVWCDENSSPTLTNCTISGNSGGGVSGSPTFILTNCTISGNSGGGVSGSPTLTNCTISGNSGDSVSGSPTLTNCTISGNSGDGVSCWDSSPTLTNCTIAGNSGGGVWCDENSSPTLTNCIVWGNGVEAIGSSDDLSTPVVTYSCIEGNPLWAGLGNIDTDPRFCGWTTSEVWVDANHVGPGTGTQEDPYSHIGSALRGYRLSLQQGSPCIGSGEGGKDMGAVTGTCDSVGSRRCTVNLVAGTYPIQGFTLTQQVSIEGAGQETTVIDGTVYGLRTGAVLSGVTITKGHKSGIVVASGEAPEIRDCTISGNGWGYAAGAYEGEINGGGVLCENDSSPTLINCTISGNSASANCWLVQEGGKRLICSGGYGGGVYCRENSSPILTNCTISRNSALGGYGGGVYSEDQASPTLTSCTITENSTFSSCYDRCWGGEGGGVFCSEHSSPTLTNCIIWGNTPESVCGNLSHCLDQDPLFVRSGEWIDCGSPDDPECSAYQWSPDTGEPTAWHRWIPGDYHLQPGSPCIDAGTSEGAPTTDIEGHGRPCGAGVDIGAYESGDCAPSTERFQRGEANADSKLDISDPVATLGFLFLGSKDLPCLDAADVDDSGTVNITDAVYSLNFLFLGGQAPAAPFGACGMDATIDALDCKAYAGCP